MDTSDAQLREQDLTNARNAAEAFLHAVTQGDEAAAGKLLIVGEGETMDFTTMRDSIASYELGEAKAEGAQAVVVATVQAKPGKEGPPELPLVLQRVQGAWMVDMKASIVRMLGMDPMEMMTQAMEGVGKAMAAGMDAMAQGLSAALGEGTAAAGPEPSSSSQNKKPRVPKKGAKVRSGK